LSTVDPAIVLLTLAALVAMFRFKVGPLPALAACAVTGVVYRLAIS
jgi:chromate transporter